MDRQEFCRRMDAIILRHEQAQTQLRATLYDARLISDSIARQNAIAEANSEAIDIVMQANQEALALLRTME